MIESPFRKALKVFHVAEVRIWGFLKLSLQLRIEGPLSTYYQGGNGGHVVSHTFEREHETEGQARTGLDRIDGLYAPAACTDPTGRVRLRIPHERSISPTSRTLLVLHPLPEA